MSEAPPFHPVAGIFLLLDGDAYTALVDDIRANGQLEPIWMIGEQVIDGRNRWRACQELGITPVTRQYTGPTDITSLLVLVARLNLHRRHLTAGQRACIGAEIAEPQER